MSDALSVLQAAATARTARTARTVATVARTLVIWSTHTDVVVVGRYKKEMVGSSSAKQQRRWWRWNLEMCRHLLKCMKPGVIVQLDEREVFFSFFFLAMGNELALHAFETRCWALAVHAVATGCQCRCWYQLAVGAWRGGVSVL